MGVTSGSFYTGYSSWTDGTGNISVTYSDRFQLSWERTAVSGTASTITATLKLYGTSTGRNISATTIKLKPNNNSCTVRVGTSGSYSNSEVSQSVTSNWYYSGGTTIGTYTFMINQTGSTEPSIKFTVSGTIGSTAVTGNSTYSLNLVTTNCTAPTSVYTSTTTNALIITPTSSFTVYWSGAAGGVSNNIVGYDIYYKIADSATNPTTSPGGYTKKISIDSTQTSGSYVINFDSTPSRGKFIVCGIVTRGAAGASFYSSIGTSAASGKTNQVKINTLPTTPNLSVTSGSVNMTTSLTITTSISGSDSDGQTRTIRYGTSNSPTMSNTIEVTNNSVTFTYQNPGGTYHFWSHDGLEFSAASKDLTLTANTTPTITLTAKPAIVTYTSGTTTSYASSVSLSFTWSNLLPNSSSNSSIYTIYYTTNNGTPGASSSKYTGTTKITSDANGTASRTLTVSQNWLKQLGIGLDNTYPIKFKIGFVINNTVSSSDEKYIKSNTTTLQTTIGNGTIYSYAKAPSISNSYNQFSDSNVSINSVSVSRIYRKIRLKLGVDTSLNTTLSATQTINNNTTDLTTPVISGDTSANGVRTLDVTLQGDISSGAIVTLNVILSNQYVTVSLQRTFTEVLYPLTTGFDFGANTIYAFSPSGTSPATMTWPFPGIESLSDNTIKTNYGIDTSNFIQVYYQYSTNNERAHGTTLNWSKSNDSLTTSITQSDIYLWGSPKDLGVPTWAGKYTVKIYTKLSNYWGGTYSTNTDTFSLNFNKNADTPTLSSIQYSINNSTWNAFDVSQNSISEGIYLKFTYEYSVYTNETYTVSLKRQIGAGSIETVKTTTFTAGATSTTAATGTGIINYGLVGEISNSDIRKWSITIQGANSTTSGVSSTSTSTSVIVHCAPTTFTLDSCTYTSGANNGTLTYSSTIENPSTSPTLSYTLVDSSNTAYTSSSTSASGTDVTSLVAIPISASLRMKLVSSKTNLGKTIQKTSYSNYVIVYALNPTIAYRKNQLGINTKTVDSSSILDIYPATGLTKISLHGTDNQKWEIILSDGIINMYQGSSLTHSINLLLGTLD